MSSHGEGAVLYIVSRSGKVLSTQDRARVFSQDDYFEGELEGWIFWGSKTASGILGSKKVVQDSAPSCSNGGSFHGGSYDNLGRTSKKRRIPFVVWGEELTSLNDIITPLTRRHSRSQQRKSVSKKESSQGKRRRDCKRDGNAESSVSGSAKSQPMSSCSERWVRMEQNLRIGLAQLVILHKWEAGTRELATRWVAWLLRMLRKARPHPRLLQHFLFTMCAAVLPVICCSLVRESKTCSPDPEICRCVDIFWEALEKSNACFSPIQWEILEEKLDECRNLRLKIASLHQKEELQTSAGNSKQENLGPSTSSVEPSPSEDAPEKRIHTDTKDEKLSNSLIQNEGVSALVRTALKEKLFTPRVKCQEERVPYEVAGSPGTIVSLLCPLSGNRVKIPARGRSCGHRASFDLQAFLEIRAQDQTCRNNAVHVRKKQKVETGWSCPICGSNATWPHIIVDRVLLRILEVLPENMPQVCLLPNGRWRMVWSPITEGVGKTDAGSSRSLPQSGSRCAENANTENTGQPSGLNADADAATEDCTSRPHCEEATVSYSCDTDWEALERAFRSWKEGIELLSRRDGDLRNREDFVGPKNNFVAAGDGEQKHKPAASSIDCGGAVSELPGTINCNGSTSTRERGTSQIKHPPASCREFSGDRRAQNVIPDCVGEYVASQETRRGKGACEVQTGLSNILGETGGTCARMRAGQHKARRKQMAKKT
ncbi:hypothetical protein R1sor_010344 [Riccia sorocarpa]|uniref:SP-RING-type domain-containing protein n=1 Tax=Riccia sorocarpa TaxID=122646 RepID=A0ABD3HXT6_9MARC